MVAIKEETEEEKQYCEDACKQINNSHKSRVTRMRTLSTHLKIDIAALSTAQSPLELSQFDYRLGDGDTSNERRRIRRKQ